jgi:hypothetical protein
MDLAESIVYMLYGFLVLIGIAIAWFIFRKRKSWAIAVTAVLLIGYIGYYVSYPIFKAHEHAEKYEQLTDYLASTYPDRQFTVVSERYEPGVSVGTFDVLESGVQDIGVTLLVHDNGRVYQISSWKNSDFPQQQDLWQELIFDYGGSYTLARGAIDITKQDEWIDGRLTVFALDIEGRPAIAIYDYSSAGYSLEDLQESEGEDFVSAEAEGRVFVYIHERFTGEAVDVLLKSGETISVDAAEHKGKLYTAD